jgi:hypothetical protein
VNAKMNEYSCCNHVKKCSNLYEAGHTNDKQVAWRGNRRR